ncbi:ATP-binding protein [Alkalithermobacter paradoxus]
MTTDEFKCNTLDSLTIISPSKGEYVGVIRLTVSGIANRMGFDIEQIEDIKVAVAEACTNVITHSRSNEFKVVFGIYEDKLEIQVKDNGKGYEVEKIKEPNLSDPKESGLGIFIIKSLMDEVEIISNVDSGTEVKMIKYLGVDI